MSCEFQEGKFLPEVPLQCRSMSRYLVQILDTRRDKRCRPQPDFWNHGEKDVIVRHMTAESLKCEEMKPGDSQTALGI